MRVLKPRLMLVPLALVFAVGTSTAYSQQTEPSKTGEGPRGTKVAPSTDPSQAGTPSGTSGKAASGSGQNTTSTRSSSQKSTQ